MDELEPVRVGPRVAGNSDGLAPREEGPQGCGVVKHLTKGRAADQRGDVATVAETEQAAAGGDRLMRHEGKSLRPR